MVLLLYRRGETMTITMTEKHQVTIPKRIAEVLGLKKGSIFDVQIHKNRIELIPVEVQEKKFTEEQYKKLDLLCQSEKGKEKRVTKSFIADLKKGKS